MSKRKRAFDINTGYEQSREVSNDPIQREIVAEDKELARTARRLRLDELIQRRKNSLAELKGKQVSKREIAQVGNQFLTGIMQMAQVDPQRAKEFLESLSQEDITKLSLLSASGQGGGANIHALMPFLKSKDTSIQDIISIVKMVQPPQNKPTTVSDVAQLIKIMREDRPQPQTNPYKDIANRALDEVKSYREVISQQNQRRWDNEIAELKNRPNFAQEMANKKAEFEAFKTTFGSGGTQNIEVEKMRLDQDRWMFEQKYQQQKDYQEMQNQRASEKERHKLIEKIAVPVVKQLRPVIDSAVNAGKRKMSDIGAQRNVPAQQMATKFLCPECAKKGVDTIIDVADMPDSVKCETCGKEWSK